MAREEAMDREVLADRAAAHTEVEEAVKAEAPMVADQCMATDSMRMMRTKTWAKGAEDADSH